MTAEKTYILQTDRQNWILGEKIFFFILYELENQFDLLYVRHHFVISFYLQLELLLQKKSNKKLFRCCSLSTVDCRH